MTDSVGVAMLGLGLFLLVVMVMGLLIARRSPSTRKSPLKLEPNPPTPEEIADSLVEFERFCEASRIEAAEVAENRRWLRPIGFVTRLLTYAALFLLLYIWAPKDISNTPLATLTLSDIAGTVCFAAIGIVLIRALFNPSDDDQTKDVWGWLGVALLGVAVIAALYLFKAR
ncbi:MULTISPECIES: hypothetical protein [Bradyrhizobium]|uniref:hypothetical protein n=1 Tax=Bradyrhizobium TaxID=374 RepID=UPI00054FD8CE|nr:MULTISPECIES: hypothetical protein [unclassified Bradyrhizobium]MDA9421746.1 hypothetical protein [Bradyrhizobium sp. CCBAU 53380]